MRFGSAGEALRWYISQPPKNGPATSQSCRLPSAVRTNAPLRVPTSTRTPLIRQPLTVGNPFGHYDGGRTQNSSFAEEVRIDDEVEGGDPAAGDGHAEHGHADAVSKTAPGRPLTRAGRARWTKRGPSTSISASRSPARAAARNAST